MVDSDRLNFFSPFRRLEPNHENQLTRALLVVLRYSPMAHTAWLRFVAPEVQLQELATARFDTQRRAVRNAGTGDEPAALVSVFLTPEQPLAGAGVVTESDRGQVLDAVIDYGGELLVVVENKVAEDNAWQASHINVTGAKIRIANGQEAVVVLWRDLLEAIIGLRERGLVAGAEAAVIDDFLTYVEDHFDALGPFRTLRLARGSSLRQTRRLRQVLGDAFGDEASIDFYGPHVDTTAGDILGASAYLKLTDDGHAVELALYPADTLSQARAFYGSPTNLDGIRQICTSKGWSAGPNFHFGHMQRGFCWTCNRKELNAYLDLWASRIEDTRTVSRHEWDEYWAWLQQEQIACPADRDEFDRHFTNTKRATASPRPGLWLARRWPLDEAEELDSRGMLSAQVREELDTVLAAFKRSRAVAGV